METLNEQDIEYLTKVENKLIRMRKREVANTNSLSVVDQLTDSIESIDEVRTWLASRMGVKVGTVKPSMW
jgi:hypothetical protein